MSGAEMLALEMSDRVEAIRQERDAAVARAEAAEAASSALRQQLEQYQFEIDDLNEAGFHAARRAETAEAALLECQWRPPGTLPDKREYVLALVYDPLNRPDMRMTILRHHLGEWVEPGRVWFTGRVICWMYPPPPPAYDIKALRNSEVRP